MNTKEISGLAIILAGLTAFSLPNALAGDCADMPVDEFSVIADIKAMLERSAGETLSKHGQGPQLAVVYGRDTRELVTENIYPWNTMGKLGNGCTAGLVGECVIVTAAHCLELKGNGEFTPVSFQPKFSNTKYKSTAAFVNDLKKTDDLKSDFHNDIAVVKLKGHPGKNGYLGMKWGWATGQRSLAEIKKFYVAGYSVDFKEGQLSVDMDAKDLSFSNREAPVFNYMADTAPGASGGMMLDQDFRLIGIHSRGYSNEANPRKTQFLPETSGLRAIGVPIDYAIDIILQVRAEPCEN
jgi:V8-like Glu-specific endopeptidase